MSRLLFTIGLLVLCVLGARGDSLKEVTIVFPAGTLDIHARMAGKPTGDPRSPDLKATGGDYQQENIQGGYNAVWKTAPDAGSYKLTFMRPTEGGWDFRYELTTDGVITTPFNEATATKVASLSLNFGGSAIFADNPSGNQTVDLTNIVATVVTGLNTFNPQDWDAATGTTFSFADLVVPAGDSGVPVGTLPTLSYGQWVKFNYDANGVPQQDGDTAAPEPGSIVLLGTGVVALAGGLRRKLIV